MQVSNTQTILNKEYMITGGRLQVSNTQTILNKEYMMILLNGSMCIYISSRVSPEYALLVSMKPQ